MRARCHLTWASLAIGMVLTGVVQAQFAPVPVDQLDSVGRRVSPAALGTPSALFADVELDAAIRRDAIAPRDSVYPLVDFDARAVARAQVWIDSLAARRVSGLHQDSYGRLAVVAGQRALADREFTARAAMPGLPVADQAYAWYTAAMAFATRDHPDWLPMAEREVARLAVLGRPAAPLEFRARATLALAYYRLGRRADAAAEAMKAYALAPSLVFEDRRQVFDENLYLATADAVVDLPDGARRLHAVDSLLLSIARPPVERIAIDSAVVWIGSGMVEFVREASAFAGTLGKPAPPITGNVWINSTDTTDERQPLAPGVVHLLYFFYPQSASMPSLLGLVRVQTRLGAGADVTGIASSLTGHWGLTFVDPWAEAEHWRQYFQHELKLPFRVVLWVKPKMQSTPWGGSVPPPNPTVAAYHPLHDGVVIVVDRQGRVRRLFSIGRGDEDDIIHYVQALDGDADRAAAAPRSSR